MKSITEQLLYEIGDPKAYLTPDVTCDFTSVHLEEVGRDRVRVSGAKGLPAPPYLKVSAVYTKGYRATGMVLLSGSRTRQKAEHLGAAPVEPAEARVRGLARGPHRLRRLLARRRSRAHAERRDLALRGA